MRGSKTALLNFTMKKLKTIKNILGVLWGVSIVVRIFGKLTGLYEIPKWSGYLIIATIFLYIVLSLYFYFKEKM